MALEQLGTRRADHKQRHTLAAIGEVLQKGEHRVVGPVQVLEYEDGRTILRDLLQESSPSGEEFLALGRGGRSHPEKWQQPLAEPCMFGPFGKDRVQLRLRDLRPIGFQDPGVGFHDLPERPECDALPVGQAPALVPGDEAGQGIDVSAQLGDEAALPDTGLTDDGDELDGARRRGLVEQALEEGQVDVAADERGVMGPDQIGAETGAGRLRVEDPYPSGLALERRRGQLLVVEDGSRRLVRREPDGNAHLGATAWRREAVFIASPVRNRSPEPGATPRRTRTSPVLTPTRRRSGVPPTASSSSAPSAIRRAARTARSGSSSWAAGTPKTPTTASPMNFSTIPPWASTWVRASLA